MKSFCIKVSKTQKKNYILKEFEKIELKNFYISYYQFRVFKNIIIHYKGNDITVFQKLISEKLANTIEKFYIIELLKRIVKKNYFYLLEEEQNSIIQIAGKIFVAYNDNENYAKEILKDLIYDYLNENKKMILDGFVNFRIQEYLEILEYIVELAVTSYLNFIDLK